MSTSKPSATTPSGRSTFIHSTTASTSVSSLQRLPFEILVKICDAITAYGFDAEAKRALSSLRLSCRRLRDIPLSYICSHLKVGLWGDHGLKKLCSSSRPTHLAVLVKSLTLNINLNLAEPHPAPYTSVQRRYSRGVVDPFDEEASPSQNRVQRLVSRTFRRGSGKPIQTETEEFLQPSKDPHAVINRFQDVVTQIIFRNLGNPNGDVSQLSSLFLSFISLVANILSSFPKLETLTLDNDLQEEFMQNLRFPEVLRWAPTPVTWERTSEQVTAALLCAYVCCDSSTLRSLRVLGGGRELLNRWDEYVRLLPDVQDVPMQDRCTDKLNSLRGLSIHYDNGDNSGRSHTYATDFPAHAANLLQRCSSLEELAVQYHSRNHNTDPRIDVLLSPSVAIKDFSLLSKLKTLTLGNAHYGRGSELIDLLTPTASTLEVFRLGSSSIGSDPTWQSVIYRLRHEFRLRVFRLIGCRYYAGNIRVPGMSPIPAGSWLADSLSPGRLLNDVQKYVEHHDDGESLVSEADEVATWPSEGDATWKWCPSGCG